MGKRKYNEENVEKWAIEYKKCYSFRKVAKIFHVSHSVVMRRLLRDKEKYNIITKKEMLESGNKFCKGCSKVLNISLFYFRKNRNEVSYLCKKCAKKKSRQQYISGPKRWKDNSVAWRKNNIERARKSARDSKRKRYWENPEKYLEKDRKWRKNNPELSKKYYLKNKDRILERNACYEKKYKNRRAELHKIKIKNDIQYRLSCSLRHRVYLAVKSGKAGSAVKDLGCTLKYLIKHLESQFYNNKHTNDQMSWDNYGLHGWHIDHIKPLVSFDLTDRPQFLKASHYTNLQPLWAKDNLSKGSKII